jgi:D-lactate dehydrogenase
LSLAETFITIAERANQLISKFFNVFQVTAAECPSHQKATKAYQAALHKTLMQMWEWSEHGKYPIVIDTTSCTHTLKTCGDDLTPEDKAIWNQLTILDGVEFLHDHVLPKLEIHPVDDRSHPAPQLLRPQTRPGRKNARHRQTVRQICGCPICIGLLRLRR